MKNEKKVCVFRNLEHEEKTKKELETARSLMQNLYQKWLSLDLGGCDLYGLLMTPEAVYKAVIDKLVILPETNSRFATKKEAHLNTLELPNPSESYILAKETRMKNYCAVPDLFELKGNEVVLNMEVSNFYIEMQNLYISDPDKIALANDLTTFVNLWNSINSRVSGELVSASPYLRQYLTGLFSISQKSYPNGIWEIGLIPDKLRQWLK